MAAEKRIAVVVRHYPEDGRLSGLVSFARSFVRTLEGVRNVTVFSGDLSMPPQRPTCRHHSVTGPFWLNVWSEIDESLHDQLVVLSGIHNPRWTFLIALLARRCAVPARRRLWVQAVTLDKDWSHLQGNVLRKVAKLATLNPIQGERLRVILPDLLVLTPGVELERIRAASAERTMPGKVRIGFFGHFNKVKGADRIPAIVDRLRSTGWECVLAGTGELGEPLREWASRRTDVEVNGYLTDPIPLLASCDVLLAPFRKSATILGLSQVVIEAMALGIPVVGTPVEAITGVVTQGAQGLLASSDEQLAAALDQLVVDDCLRGRMSAAASKRAEGFSIGRVTESLCSALELQVDTTINTRYDAE